MSCLIIDIYLFFNGCIADADVLFFLVKFVKWPENLSNHSNLTGLGVGIGK